jgi:ureidoglycolate lyase
MIKIEPLSAKAFAPFGEMIETESKAPMHINAGYALRFDDLATIDTASAGGETKVSIFETKPRALPLTISMMEQHPLGSQLFYPLQNAPWLVVVCEDPNVPNSFHAFQASGMQGVNYAKGTWHFPLIVLSLDCRFIIVDRKGSGNNLVEVDLAKPLTVQA